MPEGLVCWKCGAALDALPQPLSRRAECPSCRAELHVCRLCRHYDPAKAKQCREPVAEDVKDKTRANFCDWFQPKAGAYATPAKTTGARAELDALFGGDTGHAAEPDSARRALDDLFGGNND
ncbi:hypothetical protein EDC61_10110 [Sulfuritortus calidifontis]|uniref:Uncharacterized protein n=1 Tax=Sulfuritortus calidifontis TaxID=1914471 RepID=A0A4R3JYE3_9PROT|nr:hypothetical protein [Sulfuritortus calidifontis]TCS73788.1 hypothetical protein EDC61_10110 [Sulfuritortus calidifontis]